MCANGFIWVSKATTRSSDQPFFFYFSSISFFDTVAYFWLWSELLVWFKVRICPQSTISSSEQSHSLIWQQVLHQLVLVSEAAERVHALQHVWVDVIGRRQAADRHLPQHRLLRLWLVLPSTNKKHKIHSSADQLPMDQTGFSKWCAWTLQDWPKLLLVF